MQRVYSTLQGCARWLREWVYIKKGEWKGAEVEGLGQRAQAAPGWREHVGLGSEGQKVLQGGGGITWVQGGRWDR